MRLPRRMERAPWASAAIVMVASAGVSFILVRALLNPRVEPDVIPAPFKVVELPPSKSTARPFPREEVPAAPAVEAPILAATRIEAPKQARPDHAPDRAPAPKKKAMVTVEDLPTPQPVEPKVAEATQVFAAVRSLATVPNELLRGEAEALRVMSLNDPLPRVVRDRCALAYVLVADGYATQALADSELGTFSVKKPSKKPLDRAESILGEADQQAAQASAAMSQCRASLIVMIDAFRLDTIADLR